jgi:hypothetical protein
MLTMKMPATIVGFCLVSPCNTAMDKLINVIQILFPGASLKGRSEGKIVIYQKSL